MANQVDFNLTFGSDEASLTLLDPVGPNNTWSCDPSNFLSASSGSWAQGIGSNPIALLDKNLSVTLQFDASLNMYNPKVGQKGDAVASGDGGTVPDMQAVGWKIVSVK